MNFSGLRIGFIWIGLTVVCVLAAAAAQAQEGAAVVADGASADAARGIEAASARPLVKKFHLSSYPVAISSGKVFSLAANFFDDRFVPPAPLSNYGFPSPVTPVANADGSVDVAWLDYAGGGALPSASGLAALGAINITHINADLSAGATTNTGLKTYRLLGFTRDTAGNFYLAYSADSSFKTTQSGNPNSVNGNELRVARSASASFASRKWETIVFGNVDNTQPNSAGGAGSAGSGVLGFDAQNNVLVSYVAHDMAWDLNGVRHQAGILRLLDATSGAVIAPSNGNPWETGSGWFYSHNFNQRLLIDGGTYYTLAHGDAYSRQLGLSAFTKAKYTANDSTVFNASYWTIPGSVGDNDTNAETGQFFKLSSTRFAIAHTSSDGRTARDVRLVLADVATGAPQSNAWLTTNTGNLQAVMPKVGALGKRIFLSYGVWDSTNRTNRAITWYGRLLDQNLVPVADAVKLSGVEFVAAQPLFTFPSGPNAGALGWVSGNAQGGLTLNVVRAGS